MVLQTKVPVRIWDREELMLYQKKKKKKKKKKQQTNNFQDIFICLFIFQQLIKIKPMASIIHLHITMT